MSDNDKLNATLKSIDSRLTNIENQLGTIINKIDKDVVQECKKMGSHIDFIEKVYEMGDLEGCNKEDLISFIKNRVNTKMGDLGYEGVVNGIDPNALKRMKWFDSLSAGKQHTDFFASRVTNYSKGHLQWDESIF